MFATGWAMKSSPGGFRGGARDECGSAKKRRRSLSEARERESIGNNSPSKPDRIPIWGRPGICVKLDHKALCYIHQKGEAHSRMLAQLFQGSYRGYVS